MTKPEIMTSYDEPRVLYAEAETEWGFDIPLGTIVKADPAIAQKIIDTEPDPASHDTRSPWLWLRFANGDLMLACFPQGDTYLETEADPNRP